MQKILQFSFILLFCLPISTQAHSSAQNLPDLGSPGLVIYDRNAEIELGRAFLTALHTEYSMVTDPFVVDYVRRIGERIVSHANDGRNYRFFVIDRPEINAFAGPDGIIGINSGLILSAASEDELASVIAHEIAHITQEHLSRRFEQFEQSNMASLASLLAAILIGTQDPSAGIATFIGGSSLTIQNQLRFSRIHEHEADSVGIQLLSKANYNPEAMAGFFDQLQRKHNHTSRPPEILLTHPVTERRTALAIARAGQLAKTKEQHLDLKLIQSRLTPERIALERLNTDELEAFHCYQNYATTKNQSENINNIENCLQKSLNHFQHNRLLKIALADIQDQQTQTPNQLLKLRTIYPQDNALSLTIAQHYMQTGRNNEGIEILSQQLTQTHNHIELLSRLNELYLQIDKTAHALYFQARKETEIGNFKRANHLLQQAKQHAETDPVLTKKINDLAEKIN